jgi:hypothetical protein
MPSADASISDSRPTKVPLLVASLGVAGLAAGIGLWWRFGEGVYGQALMNAIIACF